jgi:tRNA 2-thiouridine synthesizing protein A
MGGPPAVWTYDSEFDGKETSCGEILIDLRMHFRAQRGGSIVLVIAHDAGAPIEMLAWCRLTGHRLIDSRHPYYLVQVKES